MKMNSVELTETQKGIYFDCLVDNPLSYNISATIVIENLHEKHFENALKLVIGEQEALRSHLEIVNDYPLLVIHNEASVPLVKADISAAAGQKEELLRGMFEEELATKFDLTAAPLFRVKLIKFESNKHLFIICIHHIVADGLSLEMLKKKLIDYYNKLVKKEPFVYKRDTSYSAYISKENTKLTSGGYSKQKQYWLDKMEGAEPLALQPDYPARNKQQDIGKEKRFEIPASMMKQINEHSMQQEVTPFMFLLASFSVLMNQYTQNEDVVFASPFSHRPNLDVEETIGCFVSMLPMRFNIASEGTFSSILEQVSKEFIQVYKNIGYPNNLIMRDSQLIPMPGSPSILDVSFVYDIYEEVEGEHLDVSIVDQDVVTFPGSMMVVWNKTPEHDLIKVQYKPDMFSEHSMELFGQRFLKLLEVLVADVHITIKDIHLLLENEEENILSDFNQTVYFPYEPQHAIQLFESRVVKNPSNIALIEGQRKLSYAEVNAKANQLARAILKYKSKENESVGVQCQRSMELVISILAILKAGCTYVPIDPAYPAARKEYIFEDASISLLLTTDQLPTDSNWKVDYIFLNDAQTFSGDDSNLVEPLDPFSLAYIMYTSGSTGKPKGVMVENHSVVNTLLDLERRFPVQKGDVFLLKTAFTFDVSITELFGWFMGEGSLLILEPEGEKNPQLILNEIYNHQVTHINFVPTMFRLFLELFDIDANVAMLQSLKWIFVGGEAVTPDILQKFYALNTNIKLENVYGPTECTIWVSHYSLQDYTGSANIPIGQPLNESRWYVVGKHDNLQPIGIPGELCLSGVGLARGYLNLEELTKEKFVLNPFFREGIDQDCYRYMYRTGDQVRWLPSGTIEYLGRIDFQVKVRGVRLEVTEIENVMSEYEGIIQAVVVVKKQGNNPAMLCAYYLSEQEIPVTELKAHLSKQLPSYMIPTYFVHKTELPHNNSGKIDRNALKKDVQFLAADSHADYIPPTTEMESVIAAAWQETLSIPQVSLDDNFFDIGGNSLTLIQLHNKLRKRLSVDFSITLFFQHPTIRLLAEHFTKEETETITNRESHFTRDDKIVRKDIAIIGISVHVPGADSVHEFWDNLKNDKESIHFYTDEELKDLGIPVDVIQSPNYVKAKGRINDIDNFDAPFFDYTPGEVRMMSPQLRHLYQGTWEALEDAGYYPGSTSSRIGMFIGGSDDFEWYRNVLFADNDYSEKYQAFTLSTNHFLATRIAYKLNIKGPVYSALTGCSTTLVTPHLACQSLILGECDLAVAGGITIELPNEGGYFYEDGMMFSPDGHCRPFDAKAQGTMFSNGMGLVVLKRLDEALADGDQIYAVIKGSAINNDGNHKIGFLAPSVEGQADVIQQAYRVAGIDPETVSYVEAHGTGTSLGDPIEVESLTKAFASDKKQFCLLGSVKGNVGHTDTAAGVVGLAKVALSMKHQYIPGTVNYNEPNPKIDFANTPFSVTNHGLAWGDMEMKQNIIRAGINSFGVGGTNAHMVLEQAPTTGDSSPDDKVNLLLFSAKSTSSLAATSNNVVNYLLHAKETSLSDAAWTLQVGRQPFTYRKSLVVNESFYSDPNHVLQALGESVVTEAALGNGPVYFMFSGQGSQYQGMGRDLYYSAERSAISSLFKRHIDHVYSCLADAERAAFIEIIYGDQNPQLINQTEYSQFALFATSYALAKSLMDIGIQPAGMLGHSIGEVTAATVAGVFELKDAVDIVRFRGQVMQKQPPGVMLAVMADAQVVKPVLEADVSLALENTTNSCVVGGSEEAISRCEKQLEKLGWKCMRVKTSHAFHTPMMADAAREFQAKLATYSLQEPKIPIVSNTTGTWVQPLEMTSVEYWSKHILEPVQFAKNLSEVLKQERIVGIEVGAGRTLSTFARQHEQHAAGKHSFINLIRHPQEVDNDVEYINKKLGDIWSAGVEIDWYACKGSAVRRRVSLPTYAFEKMSFPINIQTASAPLVLAQEPIELPNRYIAAAGISPIRENKGDILDLVTEAYKSVFGFDSIQAEQNFFALGGDSLKAVSLSSSIKHYIGVKVDVGDLFKYPSPGALASYLNTSTVQTSNAMRIRTADKRDYYPLSSAQSRMFALSLLDKDSVAYNLPSVTRIKGRLDKERLEQTFAKLIQRHESLRTSFHIQDNQPVQIIHPTADVPIAYSSKEVSSDNDIYPLVHSFIQPFDLEQRPLFRIELVNIGEDHSLLLFDLHHIIADGTSVETITRDFNQLYFGGELPTMLQYKDYAVWQQDYLKSQEMKQHRDYWLDQLGDDLPTLELPLDYKRPAVKEFVGGRIHFGLDKQLSAKLIEFAQATESTLFMVLLSAWNVLLSRYSGQEDVIVGTPVTGRTQDEVKDTVGMFINMLAMRNFPQHDKTFISFLHEVKGNALRAYEHQSYQFDDLVEQLQLKRELNRNALFDVSFDFQNMELHDLEVDNIRFTPIPFDTKTAAYDLVMTCQEDKKNQIIGGFLEYSSSIFAKATAERMIESFKCILQHVMEDQEALLWHINLVSPEAKQIMIHDLNDTALEYNPSLSIQQMFERNVTNHPDKVALLTAGGGQFTYQALNEKANALAWHLIQLGVQADSVVGIMPERDEHLLIAILAVLKAGGAYVPIDPNFPKERINYMLSASDINVLITSNALQESLEYDGTIVDYTSQGIYHNNSSNPTPLVDKGRLACVIFTSGSTGKPKGVMVNEGSMVNFIQDILHRNIFEHEDDRVICVTTLSFDIFGFESLVPLCTGHSIYLADELEQMDPALANQKIVEHNVTHILSTVSRIKAFVENPEFAQALKQLRCILSGGENYPLALLQELQQRSQAKLFNMYGPTETTIWSTTKELTHADSINIGMPIANTQAYIMNPAGKLQPIGVFGELYIAGNGLARGYLNNEEETNHKFVTVSELPHTRLYRTGDRARMNEKGEIELLGRLDTQIKIRGYRIELAEIEKVILSHSRIRQAVVTVMDDKLGNKHLVLHYCTRDAGASSNEDSSWLKLWLKEQLPHYMIPSYYSHLEEMPVLPNGKINKNALQIPVEQSVSVEKEVILPSSNLERELLACWKEVLNLNQISIRDNFFDVGGNSLGLILVNNKLTSILGRSIPLLQMFQYPTIESLVKSLKETEILDTTTSTNVSSSTSASASANTNTNTNVSAGVGTGPSISDEIITHASASTPYKKTASRDIAVIGMACKFPGANNTEEFWHNILNGVESITNFTDEELLQSGIDADTLSNPKYVRAKGYLDGIEYFDSDFFDYPYQESNMMDPQIRILHQCVWEALEHGGYNSSTYAGKIGLFAGSGSSLPWMTRFLGRQHDFLSAFEALTLNEKDYLTTRVSYKLNLKGPSFNIQTACSTSLVAIHQAIQSLINGESDMAIAGGVSISYPRKEGYLWHEGMILSKDGHCRPFSDDSSGTVSGNGCGLVLLKPLDAAKRDGDAIYAVIKGSAINNDGTEKIGYTAPSVTGQAHVIDASLRHAGVPAEDICYLEAHGTGTKLGDPIEIEALKQAWHTNKRNYCAIGSVKANIGHLDAAAGVAGFIKTVLMLHHRTIPPQIHFNKTNPMIDMENSPFYISTEAKSLKASEQTLRAGVSSFGIGGTNVHVIVEQPPLEHKNSLSETINILPFSARTETALSVTSQEVVSYLQETDALNLSDAAWTLQVGRKAFEYRKVLVVKDSLRRHNDEAIADFVSSPTAKLDDITRTVVFIYPDEDSYSFGMGRDLYVSAYNSKGSEIYKSYVDQVLSRLPREEREVLKQVLRGDERYINEDNTINRHLAVFAIGYALAKTLIHVGVMPGFSYGQRIGQLSAMAVAGVLSLEEAIAQLKSHRVHHVHQMDEIAASLNGELSDRRLPRTTLITSAERLEETLADQKALLITLGAPSLLTAGDLEGVYSAEVHKSLHLIEHSKESKESVSSSDVVHFNQVLGSIWCYGIDIDWQALKGDAIRRRIPLPTYVFDKKYHDHDVSLFQMSGGGQHQNNPNVSTVGLVPAGELDREEATTQLLARIWQETLGCDEVRPEDDFFILGGHSLKAITLAAQIQKSFSVDMPLTDIFNRPRFQQMVEWLLNNRAEQHSTTITAIEKKDYYAVSSAQKRMYVVNEMVGEAVPYNLASIYLVEGLVDKEQFKSVIDELVRRHEALRTRFIMIDGEAVQIIEDEVPSIVEFGTSTEEQIHAELQSYVVPFDLSQAPLMRVRLTSLSEEKHVLFIDMHHIITDQSSIAILLKEIAALYSGQALPEISIQYKDFAAWQNQSFAGKEHEQQIAYWKGEFSGEIPKLDLITDFRRPRIQSYEGKSMTFDIGEEQSAHIHQWSKEQGVTPYMIFMAGLKLLLWKSTGQTDLVVGTGISGRRHADLDMVVGMFVNTLAIRSQINKELTMAEYVHDVKQKMIKAYDNQDCQYEMLVELLDLPKDLSRNPLFDVVLNYINMGTEELSINNAVLTPWELDDIDSKFDMTWTILDKDGRFELELEYKSTLFKHETIESFGHRLLLILSAITAQSDKKVTELSIVSPTERQWLLHDLNQTATDYPRNQSIVQLFEEQVELHGQRTALLWDDEEISYSELNERANLLAYQLAKKQVKHGDYVAILLERGPLQIISILAVLKCGGTYVPIDPESPEARINFILQDSAACLLLTESAFVSSTTSTTPRLLLDDNEHLSETNEDKQDSRNGTFPCGYAEDTVYVMYTSGSTGMPKGTIITHRNVIRVVKETNFATVLPTDRLLQLSNYAFDGSVFDIFGALLNGASLVLISKQDAIEISKLAAFIEEKGITTFFVTTALFNMLVDWDVTCLNDVRKVLIGGEAASLSHVKKALNALGPGRIVNGYGPTESTFFATYYPIDYIADDVQSVPIGYPLANTTLYILDEEGQLTPSNVPGELYIGGDGVGKGYLNRNELTEQKFIDNPFEDGGKLYRTGDRVWRMPSGEIGFIERVDFQIKIRGFRVELGEIENHIKNIAGVQEVIVIAQKDKAGSLYIAAYYTLDEGVHVEPVQIRSLLADTIPDYMIPARIKRMERLPLTLNGKIDRRALPEIEQQIGRSLAHAQDAARNEAEQIILSQMQQVLDNSQIGIKDDFFRSGGQSIKAIALVQALAKLDITVMVNEIFQYPTVEGLAALPSVKQRFAHPVESAMKRSKSVIVEGFATLNEQQQRLLVEHVSRTCSMVSSLLTSSARIAEFPLSPVQLVHTTLGSSGSGFTTYVDGDLEEQQLKQILRKVICDHQLLHCAMKEAVSTESIALTDSTRSLVWSECDISGVQLLLEKHIPYLDLREYTQQTRDLVIEQLGSALLSQDYQIGALPWRLCCVRVSQQSHYVIWGFDHAAFDGMSAEVIRHHIQIEATGDEHVQQSGESESPQKYKDYVSLLQAGPQGIQETDIIARFALDAWNDNNHLVMEKLAAMRHRNDKEVHLNIPLLHVDGEDLWWFSFELVVQLLRAYTGVRDIPLAIVNYGRSYQDTDFYNCVGEFLDMIPLVIGEEQPRSNSLERMQYCRDHAINFLSLLYDAKLAEKFPDVVSLLLSAYQSNEQLKQLVLFNFQGFVSKQERHAFEQALGERDGDRLAACMVTVNYDEEYLRISIDCSSGIDTDLLNDIMETKLLAHSERLSTDKFAEVENG
ncbi:non-ribosomal peptide synthetase/type I polyketide synthase [Paenibacillus agilis]|uniref:Amino acid adenylation domain-containing protein n=1 Tax=Paenibacillus agilis TaxID=3020863 RepID=A0A559IVP8_9BACL|nr:non-ribosomal peptide synthetase/type I polyketide synthase [Paenibacillus agilis]TVX91666.1 amino acid adenylation domain-containing protein [Paenibacillus agilis]